MTILFHAATDQAWEVIGQTHPYFGVLVEPKYKTSVLNETARDEFFRSGEQYIEKMMQRIQKYFDHSCKFRRVLDFGCGVGRLVIPLARHAETVVGVDVSSSMLEEARKNCRIRNHTNVALLESDDQLSLLDGPCDLIHSYIVLQHIPIKRGYRIITHLLSHLEAGGVAVLHFTYAKNGFKRNWISWIKQQVPFVNNILNVLKGRRFLAPQMQMNNYDLNRLFRLMQANNVGEFHGEYTDHGGHLGLIVYFQKQVVD